MNSVMKKSLFAIILICFSFGAFAQIGISTQFLSYPLDYEEEKLETDFYDASYGFAIDYWARLKNYRWELAPTLSANFGQKQTTNAFFDGEEISMWAAKFHVKNNFYILDFKNDCDCPTFSKQSGWFSKAFFIQVNPGIALHRQTVERIDAASKYKDDRYQAELGLGAGFDIGLSDLITISPYFNYVITSKTDSELLNVNNGIETFRTNHILAGIRLGLRPDYARPSFKRRRALRY